MPNRLDNPNEYLEAVGPGIFPTLFVGAAILCRSRGDVGGSRTKGHDINKAILRAAYIAAGGLLHWPDANAREVLPLRMYLAA
ncbi:MAG: hypothetical protein M1840_002391 [Geoglossum simile]|nr:MAG: hypothetical protein M1840_002391 [Geoglossum simile]